MGLHLTKPRYPYGIQPKNKAYSDDQLARKKRWTPKNPVLPLRVISLRRRPKGSISNQKKSNNKRHPDAHRNDFTVYESFRVKSPRRPNPTEPRTSKPKTQDRCASLRSAVNNDLRMRTYTKLTSAESTCTLETEQGLPVNKTWSEDEDDDAVGNNNNNKEDDLLRSTVAFLAYEIDPLVIEEFRNRSKGEGEVMVEPSSVSKTIGSVRESLSPIIRNPDSDEFRSFCDFLREQIHEHYLADFLEVLGFLIKLRVEDRPVSSNEKRPGCICHLSAGSTSCHLDRNFDLEIVYVDRDTRKTKSFKGVTSLKRRRYRKSRAEAGHVTGVRVGDVSDRFVPMFSVCLYADCLCESRIRSLQRLVESYSCIRDVSIVRTQLQDQAKVRLCRAIEQNVGLYQLDMNLTNFGDDGAMFLAIALRSNQDLRALNLSSNDLTGNGCVLLARGLVSTRTLTDLNLGFNSVGDQGCAALADALTGNKCHLRRLKLRSNNITVEGATSVFASLKKNSRLCLLDLGSNDITDGSLKVLSDSLIHNRTLTDLSIDNCGLTRVGCLTIARPLKINFMLKSLSLSMNSIGDSGARRLSEGFKQNRSLTEISLNMCEISNIGFSHILNSIRFNTRMRTVKLCYNMIDIASFSSSSLSVAKRKLRPLPDVTSGHVIAEALQTSSVRDVTFPAASSKRDAKSLSLFGGDVIFGRDSAFFDGDDAAGDDVSGSELYVRLVELLHANSSLKVVLWGNHMDDDDHQFSVTTSSQESIDYL